MNFLSLRLSLLDIISCSIKNSHRDTIITIKIIILINRRISYIDKLRRA